MKGSEVRSRCVLQDFATTVRDDVFAPTHLHCQCVDYCCTQYGSIFEWKLVCAFMQADSSCEIRKDKNVMDGSGDYMER